MPRIRTIKPEILEDAITAGLSHEAFRLFVGVIVLADDHGYLRADAVWLAGQIFWCQRALTPVDELLRELEIAALVMTYEVRRQRYLAIVGWQKHQRVDHPGKARVPTPPSGLLESFSRESRESLAKSSENPRESREILATYLGPRTIGPRTPTTIGEHEGDFAAPSAPLALQSLETSTKRSTPKRARKPANSESPVEALQIALVLKKLADRTGRPYGSEPEHRALVLARLREGFSVWDMRRILGYCGQHLGWDDDPEMQPFLRPLSLWGPKKIKVHLADARLAFPGPDPDPIAANENEPSRAIEAIR